MATFNIYKLHFTSALHIGDQHEEESVSQKTIHSDTLHAAIISCLAKMGCDIPADGELGFTLSSAFPYYQETCNSAPIYFLPMPFQTRMPELADVSMAKKVKAVQWVDASLYDAVLSGKSFFEGDHAQLDAIQDCYLSQQALPKDAQGANEFVKSEVSQRVTIKDRTGQKDAEPYFFDKIIFKDWSGLYFMAEGDTTLLEKGLKLLAQEGLGTDRHLGYGTFEYSNDQLTLNLPTDADHQISLSLLIPESEDQMQQLLASDDVAYDFTRRGGWITTYPYNTLRKNAVYTFLPGSVFCKTNTKGTTSLGKIVDLTPSIGDLTPTHRVWRCGRAIMLPIKLKK